MGIEDVVQVINQTLLAHVVNDFPGGVESALALVLGDLEHVLEDLAEHLGIDGHFFLERFIFLDGEVIAVKNRSS